MNLSLSFLPPMAKFPSQTLGTNFSKTLSWFDPTSP